MKKDRWKTIIGIMPGHEEQDQLEPARQRMLERDLRGRDVTDPDVLQVMKAIPREAFVPAEYRAQAYSDRPLPIGSGQTISQPYIVALMTQLLHLSRDCDVLEIGTGSGYQTAILARLAHKVYTMEAIESLASRAREALETLDIDNVEYRVGDGSCGWPASRTFARILLTAATPDWPQPLIDQLDEAGRIVAPVGRGSTQSLVVAEKRLDKLIETPVCGCRFVKLIGKHGFA